MEAMHTDPNATEEDQKLYKEFKKDRSAAKRSLLTRMPAACSLMPLKRTSL